MDKQAWRAFAAILALLLIGCGPNAATDKDVGPTPTPVSAKVPDTGVETPTPVTPRPTLPPVSAEDRALIERALLNTSVAKVDRLHFVMESNWTDWGTTISEGDYVPPSDLYQKTTREGAVEETLHLGNKYYCKDSSGKWIVTVEDVDAQRATGMATAQAEMADEWADEGYPGTPPPMTFPTPEKSQLTGQLPLWGSVTAEDYDWGYAGEYIVGDTVTRHFVGRMENWFSDLPPGLEEESAGGNNLLEEDTLALWIDPSKEQIRKFENIRTHNYTADSMVASMVFYSYGCGVPTPTAPPPTPTMVKRSGIITMRTTIVYSRINDPSLALPQP